MKIGRRAFLKGIVATGAAAAVPAFIIRPEPKPDPEFDFYTDRTADGVDRKDVEQFDGESLFVPREGGSFSNTLHPSHATTLTRENFERARAAMLRHVREPIRPTVLMVPPGHFAQWQAILDSMPRGTT